MIAIFRPMSYASACKMPTVAPVKSALPKSITQAVYNSYKSNGNSKPQVSHSKKSSAPVEYVHTGKPGVLQEGLVKSIRSANESIEIYTYTFSSKKLAKELNKKAKAGVSVTLHIDANQTSRLRHLLSSKVKIVIHDCKTGLFHHKTMIVDHKEVWTGSGNFTSASYDHQFNLFEKIESKSFAKKITQIFSANKPKSYTIKEKVETQKIEYWHMPAIEGKVNSTQARQNVKAYKRLTGLIKGAKKTVKVANACFSNRKLADALIKASNRGVDVQLFYNPKTATDHSAQVLSRLRSAGIKLIPNTQSREHHLKFMICDDQTMVNGSPNWSSSSFSRNDESFVVVESQSKQQKQEMRSLWTRLTNMH